LSLIIATSNVAGVRNTHRELTITRTVPILIFACCSLQACQRAASTDGNARGAMPADISIAARIPHSVDEALGHASDNDFAIAMSNLLFDREAAVGYEALTPSEQVVFCLDGLEREVNNGGFHQFFLNSSGDHSLATPPALRALGAVRVAAIVEQALAVFPAGRPAQEPSRRRAQVEALGESQLGDLERLDAAFRKYPEPLAELERRYVRAHRNEFLVPPHAGGTLLPSN